MDGGTSLISLGDHYGRFSRGWDDGEVAEFGAPSELLAKEGSLFGALLAQSRASNRGGGGAK